MRPSQGPLPDRNKASIRMDNTPRKDTEGFAIPALPNGVPQDVMEIMAMIEADAAGGAM